MSSIKIINAMYDQKLFNEAVERSFEDCREHPVREFANLILKILKSSRDSNFVREALESVKYVKNLLEDELSQLPDLIEKIAKEKSYSLIVRTRAIMELGNIGLKNEEELLNIMESADEDDLKIFAFRSALKIKNLPLEQIDEIFEKLNSGQITPSREEFERLTQSN